MKRLNVILAGILALALSASAFSFDSCNTGAWYDPAQEGEGINVLVLPERVAVYFYRAGQWQLLVGDRPEGNVAVLNMYEAYPNVRSVGDGVLEVLEDGSLQFDYLQKYSFWGYDGSGLPWCIGCYGTRIFTHNELATQCETE